MSKTDWFLDEFRTYANVERAHQGIDGRSPAEMAGDVPLPTPLEPGDLHGRRLARRTYAHGLLIGYELVANDVDAPLLAA